MGEYLLKKEKVCENNSCIMALVFFFFAALSLFQKLCIQSNIRGIKERKIIRISLKILSPTKGIILATRRLSRENSLSPHDIDL